MKRQVQMKVRITEVARRRLAEECERTGQNVSQVIEGLIQKDLTPATGEGIAGIATLPDGTFFFHQAPSQELFELAMQHAWAEALRRMRGSLAEREVEAWPRVVVEAVVPRTKRKPRPAKVDDHPVAPGAGQVTARPSRGD